ncbi:MAG: hypothetical protein EP335_19050 [Alphaproteobacteria bacterium]|nr:MAG: hypothetical protein EP335_19050 [Alphaproteobacteria bacterium]
MSVRRISAIFLGLFVMLTAPVFAAGGPYVSYPAVGRTFSVSQNEHTGYEALLKRAMQAPAGDEALRAELEARRNELPPIFLYYLAEHTFASDPQAALEWYWLGHMRARMDAILCADTTAAQGVRYLPAAAKSVVAYTRTHPKESGEAGKRVLARDDLRDGEASPWWICVHGMRAMNSALQNQLKKSMTAEERRQLGIPDGALQEAPAPWLRDEADVVPDYEKLFAGARQNFDSLTAPMEEKTPSLQPAMAPEVVLRGVNVAKLYWGAGNQLVFLTSVPRAANRLMVWDGKETTMIADDVLGENVCAAGGYVSYQRQMPRPEGEKPKFDRTRPKELYYKQGRPGSYMSEKSFTYTETMVARGGYQTQMMRTGAFASWGQSSLTCQWFHYEGDADLPSNANSVSQLGRDLGFLESSGGTYHYAPGTLKAVKISDTDYPLACMKYLPFMDAFQMVACPISYVSVRGANENDALLPVALLTLGPDGPKVTTTDIARIDGERGQTQTLVTKAGIIRRMPSRYTPVGPKPGGFYLMRDGGAVKIWEGYPAESDVADDGCTIAFTTMPRNENGQPAPVQVMTWDVCKALDGL